MRLLDRPEGRVSSDLHGELGTGPLAVCAPGPADVRAALRHLAPPPTGHGHRGAARDRRKAADA